MASANLSGAVLVGGRSTRMGRDKARLLFDGQPLWRRQLRLLECIGANPVRLVLRPRQRSFGDRTREIRDSVENAGPLSGLLAALTAAPTPWLAVLAVDMPHLDATWFRRLRRLCRPGVGAVVMVPAGYEPLAAIYPHTARTIVARRLHGEKLALQDLVAELVRRRKMKVLRLPASEGWRTANWNTPADLRRGRRRLLRVA
ncbi:MAG: molybdenum cofactor guanylyltransferase [Opitutales bacterium]